MTRKKRQPHRTSAANSNQVIDCERVELEFANQFCRGLERLGARTQASRADFAGVGSYVLSGFHLAQQFGCVAADAAVVTSGTATLETALLNVPEVVVYRTLWFQVKLQPYVLKVPYVSLVNLNLGRESVVEIIQSDLDITRAERELRAILTGGEKRERMLRDFAELQAVIGAPGASDRFAARMVELLKKQVR